MRKLIGLLAVIFIVSTGQVFAQTTTYKLRDAGPAGGLVFAQFDFFGLEAAPSDESPSRMIWGDAVKACKDKSVTVGSKTFTDWVLPSKEILDLMYVNLKSGKDKAGVTYTPVGGFSSYFYWSSSEDGGSYAWAQYFDDGYQGNDSKDSSATRVRCVRAF